MGRRSPIRPAKWQRWRGLRANDRRETLHAALLVPLCAIRIRLSGLQRTRRWVNRRAATSDAGEPRALVIDRAVRAVERVRCHSVAPGTCLSRSMALAWLLRRQGVETIVRIGVRREGSRLRAHAWVECQGVVLNDRPDIERDYAPLTGG